MVCRICHIKWVGLQAAREGVDVRSTFITDVGWTFRRDGAAYAKRRMLNPSKLHRWTVRRFSISNRSRLFGVYRNSSWERNTGLLPCHEDFYSGAATLYIQHFVQQEDSVVWYGRICGTGAASTRRCTDRAIAEIINSHLQHKRNCCSNTDVLLKNSWSFSRRLGYEDISEFYRWNISYNLCSCKFKTHGHWHYKVAYHPHLYILDTGLDTRYRCLFWYWCTWLKWYI